MSSNKRPFPPHSDTPPVNVSGFTTVSQAHGLPTSVAELKHTQVTALVQFLIKAIVEIKDETGDFLLELDDGRVIDTKGWAGFEWTHGIGLYGILQFHQITADSVALKTMIDWFEARFSEGSPSKNINTASPFLTLAYLYDRDRKEHAAWRPYLSAWAEFLMRDLPRTEEGGFQHITYNSVNEGQLWDDTLMMAVLPLAKIGLVLERPRYIEEAKRQVLLHVKYLVDNKSGLFYHGWEFLGRTTFAGALWARGNCWVTIFIPVFIELLDLAPGDHFREFLVGTLLAQIKALVKCQDPKTGMWHTLLDDPTSYLESSATAGFAYAMLLSLRLDLVPQDLVAPYRKAALRALDAVLANIDHEGAVQNCSFGTAISHTLEHYRTVYITPMPYGSSMAMMALGEYLRTYL
ncbi:hypothetical protein RQP46_001791 [Phenoliferia psychrophenolica]